MRDEYPQRPQRRYYATTDPLVPGGRCAPDSGSCHGESMQSARLPSLLQSSDSDQAKRKPRSSSDDSATESSAQEVEVGAPQSWVVVVEVVGGL